MRRRKFSVYIIAILDYTSTPNTESWKLLRNKDALMIDITNGDFDVVATEHHFDDESFFSMMTIILDNTEILPMIFLRF
jgi:hypothetical protein